MGEIKVSKPAKKSKYDIDMRWDPVKSLLTITGLDPNKNETIIVNEVEYSSTTDSNGSLTLSFDRSNPTERYMVKVKSPKKNDKRLVFFH